MKKLANQIVEWLKDYAEKSHRKSFVVGVSGGVDSALVSTLCAMTGSHTHCLILPCHSKPEDAELAIKHIKWLMEKYTNVTCDKIDLTSTFEAFEKKVVGSYCNSLANANAKSRLRMIALYHAATFLNGLVVGTGNKVEDFGVGFFTKYGDGGVDISPIADLYKSEVRQMCRELGVLPELCEAIPTDGLWEDGRTDEDAIGATYDELEWAMKWRAQSEESKFNNNEVLTPRQVKVLSIYDKWHTMTAHKLLPIPTFKRT
jgi:NAD+ synthase